MAEREGGGQTGERDGRRGDSQDLIERFLAGRRPATQRAYLNDLEAYASFRREACAVAVAELLAGRAQSQGLVLEYAVEMRQRGRAWSTVRRRLATLRSLTFTAAQVGLVEWVLELPGEDLIDVEAMAAKARSRNVAYFLPQNATEIDRLDIQHYALRERLKGNHIAPLRRPARILDVGCGTGQWAYEVSAEFPQALVVGLDLVPSKRPWPAGYGFVQGNLLEGLPFSDGSFDFVHQRLLLPGVPVRAWMAAMAELVRVTRPGGWVELVEGSFAIEPAGPATGRLFEMVWQIGAAAGLDTAGDVFRSLEDYLRRAGLADVERRSLKLPMGEWGGRVGSLLATDCRTLFSGLSGIFQARMGVSEQECLELVKTMQQEWEEHRTETSFAVVLGRRP
jgi:ubiquinone/menaquinone biosynthesis C-methylase UbiE